MLRRPGFCRNNTSPEGIGGENRGEAKAVKKGAGGAVPKRSRRNGEPGCLRPHDLAAPPGRKV